MSRTYIESGNRIRVYDSEVTAHEALPVGTYAVRFSPTEGFSLRRIDDLAVGGEQVYGDRSHKIDKIFNTYTSIHRSLGVMLSGDKGQGKSLFLRMVAERAYKEQLPVILVPTDYDDIATFIDSLGEAVVIFDEFEKVFPSGGGGADRQNQFLPIFDGTSSVRRLYCVSINDVGSASKYLINRPGRVHYHMRFDYPDAGEVRAYLEGEAPSATQEQVSQVVTFSRMVNINYDHLRSIAFEIEHSPKGSPLSEIIDDLNIKSVSTPLYRVSATYADGTTLSGVEDLQLVSDRGRSGVVRVDLYSDTMETAFSTNVAAISVSDAGRITIPPEAITVLKGPENDDDQRYVSDKPVLIEVTAEGQRKLGYHLPGSGSFIKEAR